jgi:hypothetical protein
VSQGFTDRKAHLIRVKGSLKEFFGDLISGFWHVAHDVYHGGGALLVVRDNGVNPFR